MTDTDKKEVKRIQARVDDIESWMMLNVWDPEWENETRKRNILVMKIRKIRKSYEYPAPAYVPNTYSLPVNHKQV